MYMLAQERRVMIKNPAECGWIWTRVKNNISTEKNNLNRCRSLIQKFQVNTEHALNIPKGINKRNRENNRKYSGDKPNLR